MSNSLNNKESQGNDVLSTGWVDASSENGYTPETGENRSTKVSGHGVRYVENGSAGNYQTTSVSTPETRRRDRLRRLNKRFRTLSNAY